MIFRYEREFAGIKAWRDDIITSALNDGVVSTELGRTLGVSKGSNINSLYNYPVQGTAADGFKLALILLDEKLNDTDAQIVHILHDEVIVEAKDDIADVVAEIVKACMEDAFEKLILNVPFKVDPEIRDSWGVV